MAMTGGANLEAYLKGVERKVSNAKEVRSGFLEGSEYPDGTPVAMVAAIQEYGAPSKGIPPRPFMRPTVAKHEGEWPAELATALKGYGYDAHKALDSVGFIIDGQIRQSIVDVQSPPLKPATIARRIGKTKGNVNAATASKPLVDTGHMLASVKHEVKS